MAQLSYGFKTPVGLAGGLFDITPYVIDARRNEENDGVLGFGIGVVKGTTAGVQVALPTTSDSAADFEGITVNGFTTENNMSGNVVLANGATVGVLSKGRIWAQVKASLTIHYGDAVYLINDGDNKGKFSNVATDGVKIPGARFLDFAGSGNTHVIELGGIGNVVGLDLGDLNDVDFATAAPTNGQVIKYDSTDKVWEPGNDAT
ncbi:MAG: hypothetical protein IJS71_08325 [Clostridia bacterium]|nr:hypothetical protein [Clostridia bacterium]